MALPPPKQRSRMRDHEAKYAQREQAKKRKQKALLLAKLKEEERRKKRKSRGFADSTPDTLTAGGTTIIHITLPDGSATALEFD